MCELALTEDLTTRFRAYIANDDVDAVGKLLTHDHVALFELGAHPFLTLTLWIAMFERDHNEPLAMQLEFGARLAHFALPYPDITT